MAKATDLTLKREVLVYRIRMDDDVPKQEAMRWLGKAAHLSDIRFLHFLDVVSDQDSLYAVLTSESGGLLIDGIAGLAWSGQDILERIRDLAAGIREARRERLLEFSVAADNIWLDGEGRLRFINYWMEAGVDQRSVRGLSLLLYQLCARTAENPPSTEAFRSAVRPVMTELPGGDAEQAVEWACTAFQPSCALGDFERGLNRLLSNQVKQVDIRPAITVSRKEKTTINKPAEKRNPAAKSTNQQPPATVSALRPFVAIRLRPWHWFAAAAAGLCVLLIWIAARPHTSEADRPHSSAPLTAVVPAITTPASPQTPGSTSTQLSSSPSPIASAKPEPTLNKKAAFVPNLVGHTREEAEKLVLEAGLRYQFFLEANDMSKGLVYKQDLTPGTPVGSGDRIAFWVSKGK